MDGVSDKKLLDWDVLGESGVFILDWVVTKVSDWSVGLFFTCIVGNIGRDEVTETKRSSLENFLLVYIGWLPYAMPFIICQLFNCVNF